MTANAEYYYVSYRSPIGAIHILAKNEKLVALGLCQKMEDFKEDNRHHQPKLWVRVKPDQNKLLNKIVTALTHYFNEGKPLPKDIPIDPAGTAFQKKVWGELQKIAFGKTISYGNIAKKIGSPRSARAVGSACGANPIPLFIPCHRVLTSDDKLGGFGGGTAVKEQLLVLEEIAV